jgi:hypothetical protein
MLRKVPSAGTAASADSYIGEEGQLFFDTNDAVMRRSDGVTPGGIQMSGILQQISVFLGPDELIADNNNTPYEILPAPGPGLMYLINSVSYSYNFVTTPYSGDGNGSGIWYGESVSADTGDSSVFTGNLSQVQQALSYSALYTQAIPTAVCVNTPLNFWSPNAPLSNGDGTVTIIINYTVIEI